MKRTYTILILLLFISGISNAQLLRSTSKVGTTAAQFLKIGAGARAIGLGGAYSALGNDVYSLYWNPAGVANVQGNGQVAFNHSNWLADISYDFAAGAINLGEFGTLSLSFISLGVPEDKVRTFDFPEGDGRVWDANSLSMGLGFAKQLTDRFSIGFHAKYIREAIWNMSASGFALDVGTLYRTPFNDLMIGASISNFGSKMQLDGRDAQVNLDPNDDMESGPNNIPGQYTTYGYDLPLTFRIGLSMDVVETNFFRVTAAVDATHPNDNTEYVNGGLEISYDELIAIRAGYKSLFMRDSEQGLTFGAGLKYRFTNDFKIGINYGFADYNRLENVQFFDVVLEF